MYAQTAMKVKDRESRRELMDAVTDFKQKVHSVLEILRNALDSQLSNAIIAQLNDCAYKAIRKGAQKKLDERALKNESIFKANDQKLVSLSKNLDAASVRNKY